MIQFLPKTEPVPFEVFYEENFNRVVQYLTGKLEDRHSAEDLASDVFLYCYTHYSDYDPAKSSPTTWLYMIVNSRLKNRYRDAKTYVDLEAVVGTIADDGPDMDECIYLEQTKSALMRAVEQLPERQRQIVMLSYFEERSSNEIAKLLGMTPGNVRVQLSRALDKLEVLCRDYL